MTNKMPVVGQRYKGCNKKEFEVVFIFEANKQCVVYSESIGLWVQYIPTFFDYFEELPTSNSQETEECCPIETAEAAWNMSEASEVEKALEEVKDQLKWNDYYLCPKRLDWRSREEIEQIRFKHLNDLNKKAQNLVNALEDGKIKSGRGIAEYTPSDFMKHMERCEDALKNMPKPEPKIKTGTITASDVSKAWEAMEARLRKLEGK